MRLAPLTLLVGENSTGKTSFLAILRVLWEVAVVEEIPDFREPPYDLGAFSEIVYNDSSRSKQPEAFHAGFRDSLPPRFNEVLSFRFTFQDVDGVTFPVSRFVSVGNVSSEIITRPNGAGELWFGIEDRRWKANSELVHFTVSREQLVSIESAIWRSLRIADRDGPADLPRDDEQDEDLSLDEHDSRHLTELRQRLRVWRNRRHRRRTLGGDGATPFAGAPVRSKPRRTYDPSRPITDPEGENVPAYLSMMSRRDPDTWKRLKERLERFGSEAGLFDEISIESFGQTGDATPFQIQVRRFGSQLKGNRRNLIDVGYGVSQALPVITELLRRDGPSMFLLQQPEVHLHPSAQATLGSLLCSVASLRRQLVVETHSDYIIDRVRMDVRDKKTGLKPKDVSILYFERGDSDVKIHSIGMDEHGNILDAPEGYRQFFADELTRSIGL